MTPEQKVLVRQSWADIVPVSDATAALFYQRLFTIDPPARRLFTSRSIGAQGVLFMQMLSLFVRGLDDHGEMLPAIEALGRRHVGYGVLPPDYDAVGRALLWAIGQVLAERYTPSVREAWSEAYRLLAGLMQQGAASAA